MPRSSTLLPTRSSRGEGGEFWWWARCAAAADNSDSGSTGMLFPQIIPRCRLNRSQAMKQKAYALAGVDIDLGTRVKAALPRLLPSAWPLAELGKVGGFGGLFALDARRHR